MLFTVVIYGIMVLYIVHWWMCVMSYVRFEANEFEGENVKKDNGKSTLTLMLMIIMLFFCVFAHL